MMAVAGANEAGSGGENLDGGGRWGLRGKKGKSLEDNPLVSAFTRLRSELKGVKGMFFFQRQSASKNRC
jgi:hypothetical protein